MPILKKRSVNQPKSLRDNIHDDLRKMLIERELAPDARIIESKLSIELGTSRTPLREALFKLEQEGFVKSDLAKGFSVNPLSSIEVKELYPIIWTLEILAINLSAHRMLNIVKELKIVNQKFAKTKGNPSKIIQIDNRFHELLILQCRNRHLIKQLGSLKNLVQRYELAYMQDSGWVDDSIDQHNQIIEALSKEDYKLATKFVEQNWRCGMDRISTWLDWAQREE